jgi:hypothetical protein
LVFGVNLGWNGAAERCMGMGLWGPRAVEGDEAEEPYAVGSIESLLVVL